MRVISHLSLSAAACIAFVASAAPDLSLLKENLSDSAKITAVTESPIKGLYEVQVSGEVIYLSEDGNILVSGDMYDLKKQVSYTQQAKNTPRKAALAVVKDSDKIIYKAPNEKYKVTVFTDISCPYCTKLHSVMEDYNKAGITVEYLAFPRSGVASNNAKKMQRIWCAEDKVLAMNNAKLKHTLPKKNCSGNQVNEQFLLGQELGVNATPTFILADGDMRPGFYKPEEILEILKEKDAQ